MARIQPIQQSFAAGEITPRMLARSDTDGYHQSARLLENMIPYSQGPIDSRGGFQYKGVLSGPTARCFEFYVSQNIGFMVVITPGLISVFDNLGLLDGNTLITNGDFIDNGTGWTDFGTNGGYVEFEAGHCKLVPGYGSSQSAGIRRNVTGLNAGREHLITIGTHSGEEALTFKVGTSSGGSEIFERDFLSKEPISITIPAGYSSYWIEALVTDGVDTKILDQIKIVDPLTALIPYEFPVSYSTASDIESIQYAAPPGDVTGYVGEDHLYFVSNDTAPVMLQYTRATRVWARQNIPFVAAPPWTALGVQPNVITFFQGRMWLGRDTTFWGSKSASFFDFVIGGTAPDDPVSFGFAKKGLIRWLVGARNFLVGTENGEYIITSEEGLIVPGDIQAEQQSAYGSATVQPAQIGNKVIYVSTDGRKLRDMSFAWEAEAWTSKDLTFVSQHITKDDRIQSVKFAQNPDSILFMKTSTGKMFGCTYEPAMGIIGWHRHITKGKILDLCALEETGTSSVWLMVDRDEVSNNIFLEKAFGDSQLDSSQHDRLFPPGTVVVGPFPSLANRTVDVKVDGAQHPPILLDNFGYGEIEASETPAASVYVGFSYVQRFTSMPIDKGDQMGTAMGMQKRWNKIWVRILTSYMPLVGFETAELYPEIAYESSPDWLKRPPERDANGRMDIVEPESTEDVQITQLGYDKYATVHIIQDLPFKTTILGFFGEMDQENI